MPPHVVRACGWSDGGGEFVFSDGTLLVSSGGFEAYSIVSPDRPQPDLGLTAMTLSRHVEHVRSALSVFNTFDARPRLVEGMLGAQQCSALWPFSTPIDSLILSTDGKHRRISYIGEGNDIIDTVTFTCALGITQLTAWPQQKVFAVEWPAPICDSTGNTAVFIPKTTDRTALPTTRSVRFVRLVQIFPIAQPPLEWAQMLSMALGECAEEEKTVALTLPATRRFNPGVRSGAARCPEISEGDLHAFLAAAEIQGVCAQRRLHASATVVWRLDSPLVGSTPAVYWPFQTTARPSVNVGVLALIGEDFTTVEVSPLPHTDGFVVFHNAEPQAGGGSSSTRREYHLVPAIGGLPTTGPHAVPSSMAQKKLPHIVFGSNERVNAVSGGNASFALHRGRYLSGVGASCAGIIVHASTTTPTRRALATAVDISNRPAADGHTALITLSSRVEGVGTLVAFFDGRVRGTFDDRAIVTLVPGGGAEPNNELSLVAHMIAPDASVRQVRVVQCTPDHAIYPYLAYLLPFRRFAALPPTDREALSQESMPSSREAVTSHNMSDWSNGMNRTIRDDTYQTAGAMLSSPLDALLARTRDVLESAASSHSRSNDLLRYGYV